MQMIRIGNHYINLAHCRVDLAYRLPVFDKSTGRHEERPVIRIYFVGELDGADGATTTNYLQISGADYAPVRAWLEQLLRGLVVGGIDLNGAGPVPARPLIATLFPEL